MGYLSYKSTKAQKQQEVTILDENRRRRRNALIIESGQIL